MHSKQFPEIINAIGILEVIIKMMADLYFIGLFLTHLIDRFNNLDVKLFNFFKNTLKRL